MQSCDWSPDVETVRMKLPAVLMKEEFLERRWFSMASLSHCLSASSMAYLFSSDDSRAVYIRYERCTQYFGHILVKNTDKTKSKW